MKAARTRARNAKHAGSGKHGGTSKHAPTAHKRAAKAHAQTARRTATQVKAAKARALSVGEVPCCAAEALAASLRLTGHPVGPADVLALHNHATPFPGAGASLSAALEAAFRHGVAGVRPVSFARVPNLLDALTCGDEIRDSRNCRSEPCPGDLLLGVELPEGPHAVAVDGDCWLSWGACYDPWPDALIDEAWVVAWP